MGSAFQLEPATLDHARELALTLRQQDVEEIAEWPGGAPSDILVESVRMSWACAAVRLSGELAALVGLAHVTKPESLLGLRPFGCFWFLTGTACDKHPLALGRAARRLVPAMHLQSGCKEIGNWMDARYDMALRLALFCGFEVRGTGPMGKSGLPFHFVTRRM